MQLPLPDDLPKWWWAALMIVARLTFVVWKSLLDTTAPEKKRSKWFRVRHAVVASVAVIAAGLMFLFER